MFEITRELCMIFEDWIAVGFLAVGIGFLVGVFDFIFLGIE